MPMMNSIFVRPQFLAVVMAAAALGACGGGSETDPPVKTGATTSLGPGSKICVDLNQNLRCEADEPATFADSESRYEIATPPESGTSAILLVGEPASTPEGVAPLRLATLAGWSKEINVLNTMVAAKVLTQSAADASGAYNDIVKAFGVSNNVSLNASWAAIDSTAQSALREAAEIAREQAGVDDYSVPVVSNASLALIDSLARYIDGSTGQLLPGVTSHYVKTDVRGTLGLDICTVPQVQRLEIATEGGAPILDKENYINAVASLQDGNGVALAQEMDLKIRGRGNYTWEMPKMPFKLKLDKEASLLGMKSGRDWTLLANYADKTLLRNELAFCMARILGMPYTPQSRFVELTLNGDYVGQYQLTNKTDEIEIELKKQAKGDGVNTEMPLDQFNDIFLLEMDARLDADYWFRSASTIPYTLQTDTDAMQVARVERWINHLEDVLISGSSGERFNQAEKYINLESLVDFSLVNEVLKNKDAFFSSTFMYRSSVNQKLNFGPIWDFDLSAANTDINQPVGQPDGWHLPTIVNGWYFKAMMEEPKFRALRQARWKYLSTQMNRVDKFLESSAVAMEPSQKRNFQRWPILDTQVIANTAVLGSYEAEVRYLRNWMTTRVGWINQNIRYE
ncbi:CotH kinase family protein [Ottowia thiooxydans]|uniref:CotH protein n=1 Tax=Ottowia thiooxydans TaxID=219182 RepID=A0ABV2QB89_9BURK